MKISSFSRDETSSAAHARLNWSRRLMSVQIGIIPLPVYLLLLGIIVFLCRDGKMPTEFSMIAAVLAVGGFTCSEIGHRIPGLRRIGGAVIFATFIPSAMAYYNLLPPAMIAGVSDFSQTTQFVYIYISAIIVGSIFGMDRTVLIQGFIRIFVPITVGTILAVLVGMSVGAALGLGARHTLFYIIAPVMAGGMGGGAIPLSIGYADILHIKQGDIFAQVLPPVMFGGLIAILLSGSLNLLGKKYPKLTGEGRLQPGEHDEINPLQSEIGSHVDVGSVAAGGILVIMLYLFGLACFRMFHLPAPVVMLFAAVFIKMARWVPARLLQGTFVYYKFFVIAVTYPSLFAFGVAMTPWDQLVAAFALPKLITIAATVFTMVATGFVTARWIKMYPIDVAIVNSCRCAQGGTGDVAILTASNRMQLMPFAQVATRIGGAITVTLAIIALARMR